MKSYESIKYEVKKKAHQRCCICHNIGIEIHHIVPQWDNGTNALENAAPLCPSCHEIYGENPTKRKFIRESRDIWFQICADKYSPANERFELIENDLKALKKLLINDQTFEPIKGNDKLLSIGEVLDFYNKCVTTDARGLEVCYKLIFETKGDEEIENDREFNNVRDAFLNIFGLLVAEKIVIYAFNLCGIDWTSGVPENKLAEFLNVAYVSMLLLFMHTDLSLSVHKVGVTYNEDKTELIYHAII